MPSALLVIDVQKVYTQRSSELYSNDSGTTIRKVNKLVEAFSQHQWPIIFIRHVHRRDGTDLGRMFDFAGEPEEDFNFKEGSEEVDYDDRLSVPANAVEIVKTRYSGFEGTDLDVKLQSFGVDTVVVCGFMTNFCCDSTARCAHDRDYFVDFIVDATGTPGTDNLDQSSLRRFVAECLQAGYARVTTTSDYLRALGSK